MIKAIVFDCFGVLCADGWLPFKQKHFSHDQALWDEATNLNIRCDAGQLSYEAFVREVAQLAKVPVAEAAAEIDTNPPDEEFLRYIANKLKDQYKIGLLSNAGANWLDEIFTPEQVGLFDAVALSFETGHVKPHPEAYQKIIQSLGVQPNECVFIDDQPRYIEGAEQAGMWPILYRDFGQCRAELEALLANPK